MISEARLSLAATTDPVRGKTKRLYEKLLAGLDDVNCPKTLACFASLQELQDQRARLLQKAMSDGLCLYEEPIAGSFDCEFYLERDVDDIP